MQLSTRIRVARQRARMSQEALATQLGVTRGAVATWECAMGALPATARLEKLASVTEVRFEWLATGRGGIAYDTTQDNPPAVDAEFVSEPGERQLLAAFRDCDASTRKMLLRLAQTAQAVGRRRA